MKYPVAELAAFKVAAHELTGSGFLASDHLMIAFSHKYCGRKERIGREIEEGGGGEGVTVPDPLQEGSSSIASTPQNWED